MATLEAVELFIHPALLAPGETFQDGPQGDAITVQRPTLLLWIDLDPTDRFAHPTASVAIDGGGATVHDGRFWALIDGTVRVPGLAGGDANIVLPVDVDGARLHLLPEIVQPRDELTDGIGGRALPIDGQGLVFWLDLEPRAKFSHHTQYIIVDGSGAHVVDGSERPTLHGRHHPFGLPISTGIHHSVRVRPDGEPGTELRKAVRIAGADVRRLLGANNSFQLRATAVMPTSGFSDPKLVPYVYVQRPPDGIIDFDFVARAATMPPEPVSPALSAAVLFTAFAGWRGVRIHAEEGALVLRVLEVWSAPPLDGDRFELRSASLDRDQLVVRVRYEGARQHAFRLGWNGGLVRTNPPRATLRLLHDAQGDTGHEPREEELRFQLLDLPACILELSTPFGAEETLSYGP